MNVTDMLKNRNLPALLDREQMKETLLHEEYGYMRDIPYTVTVSEPEVVEQRYCCNTVQHSVVKMTVTTEHGSHTFPVNRLLHIDGSFHPFFVFLNFRSEVPDRYYPVEEIADAGMDVLSVNYNEVTTDNGDFSNGLAGIFLPGGRQNGTDCGKIIYWAWAASRILDYASTLPMLDMNQAAVMGHSRLGKTALITSMLDTRFRYAFSNDSGCCGAALNRGNTGLAKHEGIALKDDKMEDMDLSTGETIRDIVHWFPHFFCQDFQKYMEANIPTDFDQHYLVASIAPRFAYIASGSFDLWADPVSEFMSGVAASEAYEKLGFKGLVHNEKLPEVGEHFHEGRIGYHLRKGPHFLSRYDWNEFIAFIKKHQFD